MKRALEVLGFPPDAKLLIIHADDLGVCHSVNAATFKALEEGAISSASVMVPCHWFHEAAEYAARHPEADLGIHLTLTSEWKHSRWRPILDRQSCASLVDDAGHFLCKAAEWNMAEVELELGAQIEEAIRSGIAPSHIDSHMLALLGNADLTNTYIRLGRRHDLPFLMATSWAAGFEPVLTDTDILLDRIFSLRPGLPVEQWREYYLRVLRSIQPGLNQLIVHLGYDDAELQAVTADHAFWGAAWRQRDYDAVMSEEFRSALKSNGIQLANWKTLGSLRKSDNAISER
jgi:chitin disaccharide deacetylase